MKPKKSVKRRSIPIKIPANLAVVKLLSGVSESLLRPTDTAMRREHLSPVEFVLGNRRLEMVDLTPEDVAEVAIELGRQFASGSSRLRRMSNQSVRSVTHILSQKFNLDMLSTVDDPDQVFYGDLVTGAEVTIPHPDGYHHGARSLASGTCLIFAHDGRFILAERVSESKLKAQCRVLDKKKLVALIKRFPDLDLTRVLVVCFFPNLIKNMMSEIEIAHRNMKQILEFAQYVANRVT